MILYRGIYIRNKVKMNIKVGVRVRPFNLVEKSMDNEMYLSKIDKIVRVNESQGKTLDFEFDDIFWQCDEQMVKNEEKQSLKEQQYCDQSKILGTLAHQIEESLHIGQNYTIFSYGATATGKTYSIFGNEPHPGISHLILNELFADRFKGMSKGQMEIQISMYEIFLQKIQDLLIPIKQRPIDGLKIRQNKGGILHIQGLSSHKVQSANEAHHLIHKGLQNRMISATMMSMRPNRGHLILKIDVKTKEEGVEDFKCSSISLVDLAGSEKIGKTNATEQTLKQAVTIGKSLSVFSNIINALAEKSKDNGKKVFVPYRDAKITRIFQQSLGGRDRAYILCSISPSSRFIDQTKSTLRFGVRARKVRNIGFCQEKKESIKPESMSDQF